MDQTTPDTPNGNITTAAAADVKPAPINEAAAIKWYEGRPKVTADEFRAVLMNGAVIAGKIILIVLIFVAVDRLVRAFIMRMEKRFVTAAKAEANYPKEAEKRITTVFSVVKKALVALLWVLGVLVALRTCGIDVAPILAAAGVLGLAIGLGAQSIVKDMFTGVILLLENHIRVGDSVVINGKNGAVEAINLRTLVLRDATGTLHVIPNGSVTELSNQTIDWSATVINLTVTYDTDVDELMELMHKVGAELKSDPAFAGQIISEMEVFGVTDFNDGNVNVRARIRTTPGDQWSVEREYRRRLKKAMEQQRILPPSRNITFSSRTESALLSAIAPDTVTAPDPRWEAPQTPDKRPGGGTRQ
ncbi:mechanosensitive ion channel family protein [Candidatus Sumerlaeota bacterium]|nr:mechanosensitive ion channel family protein [Candidatus Sumerlaeota bacterium]